jgi:lysophosphatidylcholine acyltransferase/lyso-PAF acetyltransferase
MLMSGVFWVKQEQRRDIDYRKYLGPDWKPSFEGAGILVINHQSWLDIMVMLYTQCPSFVSKQEVLSYPGIGKIAECIQSIFLNRTDSKEKLAEALETIKERQIKAEKGLYPQLFICPEGATTNGEGIISFKRGAFASLRAVRPMVINYWTLSNVKAT